MRGEVKILSSHPFPDLIKCLACDTVSEVEPAENTCPNCLTEGENVWAEEEL